MIGKKRSRIKETVAMALIGEGVAALINPKGYFHIWNFGPKRYRKMIKWFEDHPNRTRMLAAAETGLGVALAWKWLR